MKMDINKFTVVPSPRQASYGSWIGLPAVMGPHVMGLGRGKVILGTKWPATQLRRLEHLASPRKDLRVAQINT